MLEEQRISNPVLDDMYPDEPRIRYERLLGQPERLKHAAEWEQINKLERLQRSVRLARARLGLRQVPAD